MVYNKIIMKGAVMLISKQDNEVLYYYIFKDDNKDVDDLIFSNAELPVSEK
jgi:hypothetical protein